MISLTSIRCPPSYRIAAVASKKCRIARARIAHVRQPQSQSRQETVVSSHAALGVRRLSTFHGLCSLSKITEDAEPKNEDEKVGSDAIGEAQEMEQSLEGRESLETDQTLEGRESLETDQSLEEDIECQEEVQESEEVEEAEEEEEEISKSLQAKKSWVAETYPTPKDWQASKELETDPESLTDEEWRAEEEEEEEEWTGFSPRSHPLTLEGKFHGNPIEILLPRDKLVEPLRSLLERAHVDHVKLAAEKSFGGRGLPTSPVTPVSLRKGHMSGIGLPPDSKHMTEIQADAFLAAYMPGVYTSSISVLRETRKRLGKDWIQSRLKDGGSGLSILDAGAGGGGLIAWDQIVQAEWDLLAEKGQAIGEMAPVEKTVVVGSDRLRQRLKRLLNNTTFMPRLPDYVHSGKMKSGQENLDSGSESQNRKSYDVIIASHLFLKEKQQHDRRALLQTLWALLNEDGGVLIVVEKAHPRGFEAMAHVRDTVLKEFLLPQPVEGVMPADVLDSALEPGHIIAPCTNHKSCPLYLVPGVSKGRKDFCHFSQRFVQPSFYKQVLGKQSPGSQGAVEFSYVAVQRGAHKASTADPTLATEEAFKGYARGKEEPAMGDLPRIILPPLKRKGHVVMDVCTAEGRLERWTVPKSRGRLEYHDARKSRWGDLWALGAKTRVGGNVRTGKMVDEVKEKGAEMRRQKRERKREEQQKCWPDDLDSMPLNGEGRREGGMTKREKALERLLESEDILNGDADPEELDGR